MVFSSFMGNPSLLAGVDIGRVVVGVGDEIGEDFSVLDGESGGQSQNGGRKKVERVGCGRRWRRVDLAFLVVELLHGVVVVVGTVSELVCFFFH